MPAAAPVLLGYAGAPDDGPAGGLEGVHAAAANLPAPLGAASKREKKRNSFANFFLLGPGPPLRPPSLPPARPLPAPGQPMGQRAAGREPERETSGLPPE